MECRSFITRRDPGKRTPFSTSGAGVYHYRLWFGVIIGEFGGFGQMYGLLSLANGRLSALSSDNKDYVK